MSRTSLGSSNKREKFEEQLRSLQADIGELSQKLSIPLNTMPKSFSSGASDGLSDSSYLKDETSSKKPPSGKRTKNVSFEQNSHYTAKANTSSSQLSQKKAEVVRLSKELRNVTHERDDMKYRYDQLKRETEEMKKAMSEFGRLRVLCENLKQDNESLKMSLESSEKIRKQQKELILMMQRSTQYSIENSSHASSTQAHSSSAHHPSRTTNSFTAPSVSESSVGSYPIPTVSFAPSSLTQSEEMQHNWIENRESIPPHQLASPAVYGTGRSTGETVPPKKKLNRKPGSKTSAKVSTKRNPAKKGVVASSRPPASRRTPSAQGQRVGLSSKSTRRKAASKVQSKPTNQDSTRKTLDQSFHSASTSGVLSYDNIINAGKIVSPQIYGQHSHRPSETLLNGRPPRPALKSSTPRSSSRSQQPRAKVSGRTIRSRSFSPKTSRSQQNV